MNKIRKKIVISQRIDTNLRKKRVCNKFTSMLMPRPGSRVRFNGAG